MVGLFDRHNYLFNVYAIPIFVTALAIVALGLAVIIRERGSSVSILFFLTTLSIGTWLFAFTCMYSAAVEPVALWWAKAAYLGVSFIPAAIWHFTTGVLRINQQRKTSIWVVWLLSVIFEFMALTTDALIPDLYRYWWGFYPRYGWLGTPFLGFFFGMMIISLYHYWLEYRKSRPGTDKLRIKTFMIAFSIAYIGSFDYLAKYGVAVYPFGYIAISGFLGVTAWGVWRYRLVDLTPSFAADQILETMQGAVLVTDPEGEIRVVNRAACVMLRYSESELLGMSLTAVFQPPSDIDTSLLRAVWADRVRDQTMAWRTKDGERVDVSISASPLAGSDGRPVGSVYVALDITDRKRAEENLARQALELSRSNLELEQFAYVASHDLQEPLRKMASYAELLERRYRGRLDQDADKFIGYILGGATRMRRLISDLLTYSKVGRGDISVEWTDLSLLIKQLLIDLESLIQESGAIVTYDDLPSISANPTEMAQLFQNLVGNAIKFRGKESPEVHISAACGEKEWTFSVRDNGIGIDPPSIGRIFQLFQRLHTKQEYPGTGIGLAVCKKIVERRGGRIWAESEPGKGSTFYFTLPIVGEGSSGKNGAPESLLTEPQSGDAGETVKHLEEVER